MRQQTIRVNAKPPKTRRRSRLRTIVLYMQGAVMLFFGVGIGGVVGTFMSVSNMLPKVTNYSPPEATKIYSSDNVLLTTLGAENREYVKFDDINPKLRDAVVAVEDNRFYEHAGVDFRGIARAVVENVRGGAMMQGGSTITQQLVRNVYLTQRKTMSRKLREVVLAILIERKYPKNKILELYLNQVYFGSRAYGVEAASKTYFGKTNKELNLAECALLAGLPQAPSRKSPHVNLEAALDRRDEVLTKMAEQGKITIAQRDDAMAEKPRIAALRPSNRRSLAPYFTDYVKKYLMDKYEYSEDFILRSGLRVYTTVNWKMQEEAQKALEAGVARTKAQGVMNKRTGNAALICIEPGTGYIRAMVGGCDYGKSEFNRATQAERQPGSSFKLFVYTAAVDKLRWEKNHSIRAAGGRYTKVYPDGTSWSPKNYDGRYYSSLSMEDAIAKSVNIQAIVTANEVGLDNVIHYARMMGVTAEIEKYPALAIGGIKYGVKPIEMAAAYGVIASGGYYAEPTPIAKVLDSDGQLLEEREPNPKRILPEKTVKVMDDCFRAVVTKGTGRRAFSIAEARGKTGTTNNDADAWFIGYVPGKLVTAVWAGNENRTGMNNAHGSTVCLPIWKDFMEDGLKVFDETHRPKSRRTDDQPRQNTTTSRPNRPNQQPTNQNNDTPPDDPASEVVNATICDTSQLLATRSCPSTHTEEFVRGSEPSERCNVHGHGSEDGGSNDGSGDDNLRLTPPPPINTTR